MTPPRFRVEKIELQTESEGPDYFTTGEFRVTDIATGRVVAAFPWTLDEPYLTNKAYSGPERVDISADGCEAIASYGDRTEQRVLLPGNAKVIMHDGVALGPDADWDALVHRVAREDGPRTPDGHREPGGQWLWRIYQRLGLTERAEALEAAVAALLDDADPRARAAALRFYYFLPRLPGAGRAIELARTRPELYGADQPGSMKTHTLADDLREMTRMKHYHDAVAEGREPHEDAG